MAKNMTPKLYIYKSLSEVSSSKGVVRSQTQWNILSYSYTSLKLFSLMQMILWRNENCRSQLEVSDWVKYNHIPGHTPDLMIHS